MIITVVGAGALGRGIAQLCARGGFRTVLEDISGQMLPSALEEIRTGLDADAFARIVPMTRIEDSVRDADFVIEAVPEDMETKLEIFTVLDKSAPPNAILASTTTALSMTEIASITLRSARILGMHFSLPKLVEIVRGLETGEEALTVAEQVARTMGLQTIRVQEAPGSVVARMRALKINEAFALVQEGVAAPAAVDAACRLAAGDAAGPFEAADAMGLDNLLQELERLEKVYGDRFRPNPLLAQYVKAGRTGKRAGRGVYQY